ncbi:hypothetical protein [Mycoplasmopsis fermentans]|uniref:hypothetical protein n=1 Tax=Mycoplasmopsis fermentans TaxID=2115 RepID=UPI001004FEA6|nr:hypothetical protein [Mycoplasmopsis fermentans]VEU64024.1 Uncharacterised protein [Mycoplasmopsis fermentans]
MFEKIKMNRWRCRCCQILTNDKKREVFNYKNEEYVFPYFCQKCCQRLINWIKIHK